MAHKEQATTREYAFTAVFAPAEEGGYTVTVPALPGIVTESDTLEDARAIVADAIEGYLELLQEDGLPIPVEEHPPIEPIREAIKVRLEAV